MQGRFDSNRLASFVFDYITFTSQDVLDFYKKEVSKWRNKQFAVEINSNINIILKTCIFSLSFKSFLDKQGVLLGMFIFSSNHGSLIFNRIKQLGHWTCMWSVKSCSWCSLGVTATPCGGLLQCQWRSCYLQRVTCDGKRKCLSCT